MFKVVKTYKDLPAAHRQHKHVGHCRQIHGHNWGFDITFTCEVLDENGFVVDVGKLKPIKQRLEALFDHTTLINADDPLLHTFKDMDAAETLSLVIVPNCGMEKLAELVFRDATSILVATFPSGVTHRKLRVLEVVCWEDSKNKASFKPDSV